MRWQREQLLFGEQFFEAREEFALLKTDVAFQEIPHFGRDRGQVRAVVAGGPEVADEGMERFMLGKQSNTLRIIRTAFRRHHIAQDLLLFVEVAKQVGRVEGEEIIHRWLERNFPGGRSRETRRMHESLMVVMREWNQAFVSLHGGVPGDGGHSGRPSGDVES